MGVTAEADEAGNLLARIPGRGERSVLLCAHMDTVEHDVPIEPVLVDGGWENEHDGILGADNKAALAVMLEVARRASVEGSPVAIELLFTVAEEDSLAGAKGFDASRLRSDFGYVFDQATPIGEIVDRVADRLSSCEADFHGKAAHAGLRPEDGHSAILAAARAIAAMPLGRIDPETTANVGSVHGGVGTTNVVPERCRLTAEARSLDPARVETVVSGIVDALYDGAAQCECDVDVVCEKTFTGLQGPVRRAGAGGGRGRAAGVRLRAGARDASGGGSDANVAAGVRLPLHLPGQRHRAQPRAHRARVGGGAEGMLDVALALLDEAAAA